MTLKTFGAGLGNTLRDLKNEYLSALPHKSFLFGLLCIAAINLVKREPTLYHLFAMHFAVEFFRDLGIALIIAWFIAMSIERIAKRNHDQHIQEQINNIKENVFGAIFYRDHDENLINSVVDKILKYNFYRKNSTVTMAIRNLDESHDFSNGNSAIILDINMAFDIINITDMLQTYDFCTFLEKTFEAKYRKHVKLNKICIGNNNYTADQIKEADGKYEDTTGFIRHIYPITLEANQATSVSVSYTLIKYARDEISCRQVMPCDGMKVILSAPKDLIVKGTAFHHRSDIEVEEVTQSIYQINIDEPLFPHNGVSFWWFPKSFESDGTDTEANISSHTASRKQLPHKQTANNLR